MDFKYGKISDSRKKELEDMNDLNIDMPVAYKPWSCPMRIRDSYYKTEDEFYIIDMLSDRARDELDLTNNTYLLIMGKNHLYFDAHSEALELNDTPLQRSIYVMKNEMIESMEKKKELLGIIKDALIGINQPISQRQIEEFGYIHCNVIYDGMEIE